jgi:hypothetical protein
MTQYQTLRTIQTALFVIAGIAGIIANLAGGY